MLPKLFVIIVTYKGHQWYERCFTSLRNSEYPVQTIVIDNASNDGTVEYIREHFPEIHLIESKENLGFGRANNIGMRYALDNGGDYVFLLNQDTWIEEDSIEKLVRVAENHPEYGIISPIHLTSDKKSLNLMYEYSNHSFSHNLLSDLYCGMPLKDIYQTDYVNAAAWLLPRKILEYVGGFDPIFRHYEEDDSYLLRTQYHSFKIGICPSAIIVHDHIESVLSNDCSPIRQQQYLLVDWTNINQSFSIWKESRYYSRKWLSYLLAGNFKQARIMRNQMRYCFDMRKAIEFSRTENKQKKSSWL